MKFLKNIRINIIMIFLSVIFMSPILIDNVKADALDYNRIFNLTGVSFYNNGSYITGFAKGSSNGVYWNDNITYSGSCDELHFSLYFRNGYMNAFTSGPQTYIIPMSEDLALLLSSVNISNIDYYDNSWKRNVSKDNFNISFLNNVHGDLPGIALTIGFGISYNTTAISLEFIFDVPSGFVNVNSSSIAPFAKNVEGEYVAPIVDDRKPIISSSLVRDENNQVGRLVRIDFSDYYENKEDFAFKYHVVSSDGVVVENLTFDKLQYDSSNSSFYYEFVQYYNSSIYAYVVDIDDRFNSDADRVGNTSDILSINDLATFEGYTRYVLPSTYDKVYISGLINAPSNNNLIYVEGNKDYTYQLCYYSPSAVKWFCDIPLYDDLGYIRSYQYSLDTARQLYGYNDLILFFERSSEDDDLFFIVPSQAYVSMTKLESVNYNTMQVDYSYVDDNGDEFQESNTTIVLSDYELIDRFKFNSGFSILDNLLTSVVRPILKKFPIIFQIQKIRDMLVITTDSEYAPEFRVNLDLRNIGVPLVVNEKVIDFHFYNEYRETVHFFIKVAVTIITILKMMHYFDKNDTGVV